ncbi:MAG TPA: iron donor protein CyaY [Planctomycetes bacterium]|nr:iron donor protein CyaY [Planctomycetota bacterium]HIL37112.1 iron donor protein CyaY [Planctomycetota bacterium]
METNTFLQRSDACLEHLEDWLEGFDADELDYSSADGVIKLEFASGPQFVLNRQSAASQMWFAAATSAWHYTWDNERSAWLCDRDEHELFQRLAEMVSQRLGRTVKA